MRILLVEDHRHLARDVASHIRGAGFAVDHVISMRDAMDALANYAYAVALLDRRLPDGDGLKIVAELKRTQPETRVLMLTALDAVDDRIAGLESGADDYLVKPFDLDEMVARIRACLRRSSASGPVIALGALSFDPAQRSVSIAGRPALFHHRELALIEALLRRARVAVRRETLMQEIWGFDEEVQPHALTMLVARLRTHLDELGANVEIHAARGVGYMIAERNE